MVDNRLAWALPNTRANLAPPFITSTGQTTIMVGTGQGALFSRLPVMAKVIDTLDLATATRDEDLLVTARVGDTLTIQRGFYGRAPQTFATGGTIWVLNAAETINRLVTAAQRAAGTIDVSQLATGGDGSRTTPWTGWSAALAAAYLPASVESDSFAGLHFYFPPGYYTQDTTIEMGLGWVLRGAGPLASRIISNQPGSFIQVRRRTPYGLPGLLALPNHRGGVYGLYLENLTATTGVNVDVTNQAYFHLADVSLVGGKYGLIWDGAEHCTLTRFDLGLHSTAGIWLLNGSEHEATYPGGFFTNNNTIAWGNINESGAACAGIAHDGGQANSILGVGFNAGVPAIHASAGQALTIEGCYLEGGGTARIVVSNTSFGGVAKVPNAAVTVRNCFIHSGTAGQAGIQGVGTPGYLSSEHNLFTVMAPATAIQGVALFQVLSSRSDMMGDVSTVLLDANPPTGLIIGDPDGSALRWGIGINTAEFGGGNGVLAFAPAGTVPVANGIANGGILYVSGGNLYYRSSAGNVRLVAAV